MNGLANHSVGVRVAHISDLHICTKALRREIEDLSELATRELGTKVSISIAEDAALDSLRQAIVELDPDVICVTGDITTFGDKASFADAATFIKELTQRTGGDRVIVVAPGNHDALASQLRKSTLHLRSRLLRVLRRVKLRETDRALRTLLANPAVRPDPTDLLANFRRFAETAGARTSAVRVGDISQKPIWILPFNSVSSHPLWLNIGETTRENFARFYSQIRGIPDDSVLVVLVHHNPISSPDIVDDPLLFAYNTTPGSALLVRELQTAGTDLVLYGHQHQHASCVMDLAPESQSHLNLLGAPSATCGGRPGFNIVEIFDRFRLRHALIEFNQVGGFDLPGARDFRSMFFDIGRPNDELTLCTKSEIRYFRYLDSEGQEEQWERMHEPGARDLLIVGLRLKRIMRERRPQLERVLRDGANERLRILISDPALYEKVEGVGGAEEEDLSRMFGESASWRVHSRDAQLTLEQIDDFRKEIGSESAKLEVRLAHTLLPIGAVARDTELPTGSMLIRLLPVGLIGSVKKPVLRLTRRHPAAVYEFYHAYIKELWNNGSTY